jgi:hypothetical protein
MRVLRKSGKPHQFASQVLTSTDSASLRYPYLF